MTLSLRSILSIALIFTFSLLGQQALSFLQSMGVAHILAYCLLGTLLVSAWSLLRAQSKLNIFVILIAAALLSRFFVPEELLHLILFGMLGAALAHDFRQAPQLGVGLGTFLCVADEALQWALPYRVGDVKDVALNLAAFFLIFLRETKPL